MVLCLRDQEKKLRRELDSLRDQEIRVRQELDKLCDLMQLCELDGDTKQQQHGKPAELDQLKVRWYHAKKQVANNENYVFGERVYINWAKDFWTGRTRREQGKEGYVVGTTKESVYVLLDGESEPCLKRSHNVTRVG